VEHLQEEHPAQAPAYLAQDPEQYPAPTEKRRHPEIRDDGQRAGRGEQRSPAVSRAPQSGGSPGEAEDETVTSQQDSEIGQRHPALLQYFLCVQDITNPPAPAATRLRNTSRLAPSPTRGGENIS